MNDRLHGVTFRGWVGDAKDKKKTVRDHFNDARHNFETWSGTRGDICICSQAAGDALGPWVDGIRIWPWSETDCAGTMPHLLFYVGIQPKNS
jgi:hypothetical protein